MGATKLTISVSGIEDVLQSFNVIRVKRSVTGVNGTYSFLTANAPTQGSLTAPTSGDYDVVGKTLQLQLDQAPQINILFIGALLPLTAVQVSDQINAAVGETVAFADGEYLRITSSMTGTISKVLIVGGSATPIFGWLNGEKGIGLEAHVTLQTGVSSYTFTDNDGQAGYFYTAQFYNTNTFLASTDSAPFEGDVGTLVTADRLSRVKVDLVDSRGIAIPGQEITFYPQHEPLVVEGFQVALNRAPVTIKTDNAGHAEVSFVRGLHMRVVFEGTSIIRDISIPDAEETNLLTQMGQAPDPYDITTIPFPTAPRRTL
jgi:hypothetical protein